MYRRLAERFTDPCDAPCSPSLALMRPGPSPITRRAGVALRRVHGSAGGAREAEGRQRAMPKQTLSGGIIRTSPPRYDIRNDIGRWSSILATHVIETGGTCVLCSSFFFFHMVENFGRALSLCRNFAGQSSVG